MEVGSIAFPLQTSAILSLANFQAGYMFGLPQELNVQTSGRRRNLLPAEHLVVAGHGAVVCKMLPRLFILSEQITSTQIDSARSLTHVLIILHCCGSETAALYYAFLSSVESLKTYKGPPNQPNVVVEDEMM